VSQRLIPRQHCLHLAFKQHTYAKQCQALLQVTE
jgi:hypothetical protein